MDTGENTDLLSGTWVNFQAEMDEQLTPSNAGKISVVKLNGKIIEYDGTNDADMKGFYRDTQNNGRLPFLDLPGVNPYLSPIGRNQINNYESKGYTLEQTEGWSQ